MVSFKKTGRKHCRPEVAMIKMVGVRGGGATGRKARVGGRGRKGTVAEGEKFYECGCQCKATAHLPPRPSQINTGSKSPQPRMLAACQGPPSPCSGHSKQRTHTHTHTLCLSVCLSHTLTHTLEPSLSLTHIHTHKRAGTHTPIQSAVHTLRFASLYTKFKERERD